jgi:hypothetical protein
MDKGRIDPLLGTVFVSKIWNFSPSEMRKSGDSFGLFVWLVADGCY